MKILSAAEMREVDRLTTTRYGVPSVTLMENAGASVVQFIAGRWPNFAQRRIVVLCGKGNNGGDGFVVARHLLTLGAQPEVYLFAAPEEMQGDAATNCKRWQEAAGALHVVRNSDDWRKLKPALVRSAEIIVDALLGTGFRGPAEGLLAEVFEALRLSGGVSQRGIGQSVVAVDIPSGLNSNTGEYASACIRADYTVTFTAPKIGMLLGTAEQMVGELVVRNIGSPRDLITEIAKGKFWWSESQEFAGFGIPRRPVGNKGDYGHALIVAGSYGKSGAAVLASWAALRIGAGLVTAAIPKPVLPIVAAQIPEIMTEPLPATDAGSISLRSFEYERFEKLLKGKRALAIGPGLTTNDETQQFVRAVVGKRDIPIVLDADGLNAFAGRAHELKNSMGNITLTPHPGEMARLLGCETAEVQARRLEVASTAAAEWNACVVLKGHQTVVASPTGEAFVNSTGNPGMATGGTGDVLTGMLAGLIGQWGRGLYPVGWAQLAAFGVYLHGLAGDVAYADSGAAPLMASDLIKAIPRAYQQFYSECGRG